MNTASPSVDKKMVHSTYSPAFRRIEEMKDKPKPKSLFECFLEANDEVKKQADSKWADELKKIIEKEEEEDRRKELEEKKALEQADLELAKKILAEEEGEILALQLQEEEDRLEAERRRKLEEIEFSDLDYVRKLQKEEEEEKKNESKREEEDEILMRKLQKEEMEIIIKEMKELDNAWHNPKVTHGDDKDGVWVSVYLPYLKKFGFVIDKEKNVLYVRAEPIDITKGKKEYLINEDILFSLDLNISKNTPIKAENITGSYCDKSKELTIRIYGVKLNEEEKNNYMNRFKMGFKRLFKRN